MTWPRKPTWRGRPRLRPIPTNCSSWRWNSKDYVDKSNENVLSLDVVKKAEEIEKLAHSVKDKMKGPN